jgi:uncharacterized ion transporter superfamily protein YfcC
MKQRLSQEANRVILTLVIILGIFIIILGITLIITSSKFAQQGYVLKQAQIENNKLRLQGEELKTKIVEVQSFQTITKNDEVTDMQEIEQRQYVVPKN